VLINLHGHAERPLDISNRAAYIQHQAIGSRVGHRQTVRAGETAYPLIVVDGRTKSFCELLHRQELAVIGTGWIVELAKQAIKLLLVA